MAASRLIPAIAAFAFWSVSASAEFARVETEKVPVERLVKNLEAKLEKDPKNHLHLLNLGRVHAVAFVLCSEEVDVLKEKPDQVMLHPEYRAVPYHNPVKTDDPEKLKAAKAHLDAAIKYYGESAAVDPDNLYTAIGRAWLLTKTDRKADAIAALRAVIEKAWKLEKDFDGARLGGYLIATEAGGYLLPYLDAAKDKDEIAAIMARTEKLSKMPFAITPVAIPLKDGLAAADLEDRTASVNFNAAVYGAPQRWTWITRNAAWLVSDPKHSGRVTSGLQLFGNATFYLFWETGYDALAALDDDGDGRLSDRELEGLALWHDANGNGISDPGEVKPLSSYGIVALSCDYVRLAEHPDRIAWSPVGVTYRNGTTRPTYDLVLHSRPE